ELGESNPDRNWKGIGISLLVIAVVCSFIALAIILLSSDDALNSVSSSLTLDDLFRKELTVHDPEAKWINDEEIVYRDRDGNVMKHNVHSNQTGIVLKNATFSMFKASTFAVSPDQNFVLLGYSVKQVSSCSHSKKQGCADPFLVAWLLAGKVEVYKYSFTASYSVYDLHTREIVPLNPPEVPDSALQYASWGIQKQQLVYIFENNIYYQSDRQSNSLRLTSSGKEGVVFNGIADWLYEVELLQSHVAHWWSPDGEKLAFLPNMALPRLTGSLYPRGQQYPYPKDEVSTFDTPSQNAYYTLSFLHFICRALKAGQVNPTVKLYVVNVNVATQTVEMVPPNSFQNSDYYISMVKWTDNYSMSVRWLNRPQNTSILTVCEASSGECVKKHVMTSDIWLDRQNEQPVFSKDGSKFFLTIPIKHGARGDFHHIAMFSDQSGNEEITIRHLTSGNWEVTEILAFDETQQIVYFLSTEDSSAQRQLYRVSVEEPFNRRCLTCGLYNGTCTFVSAEFSPTLQSAILNCKDNSEPLCVVGPDIPKVSVHWLNNLGGFHILESNTEIREFMSGKKTLEKEVRILQVNNHELPMELTLPAGFSEKNLHPLLLIVDGAPGSQAVNDKFLLDWDSVLVSSDGVIVARFDGRGSGFQGQKILQQVHQRLGTLEVQDQKAAIEALIKLPYIDKRRIGVFGKAYGGFLTSLLLLSYDTIFRCGVAVAPVTDWRLYASAFTERYLGFPSENDRIYQTCGILHNMTGSTHHKFLIIHGTADSNVHFQHTAELVKRLSQSNVNYMLKIYPDEGHDITSSKSRYYHYRTVMTFFRECFYEDSQIIPEQEEDD
ncbi:DPP10 peptidase, partial [Atractosteus spatula]|nr:DPP10 peptidase [Atractosteus spatula]